MADLLFWAKGLDGAYHQVMIMDVLYDPLAPVNLISVDQFCEAYDAKNHFGKRTEDNFAQYNVDDGEIRLQFVKYHGIYAFVTDLNAAYMASPGPLHDDDTSEDEDDRVGEVTGVDNVDHVLMMTGIIELEGEVPLPPPIRRMKSAPKSVISRTTVVAVMLMVTAFLTLGNMSV